MTTLMMTLYLIVPLFLSYSILEIPLVGNDQETDHFHVKVGDSMKDLTLVARDHGS